jgi:glycosyltransferase involved in cell wall biosynthesis
MSALPRRLAFCITELDPGGAERALLELVRHLPRELWESRVYCLGPEAPLAEEFRRTGTSVECLGARSARDWMVLWRLAGRLREYRPALLQTFLSHGNIAGRIAGWWAGVPCIVSGLRVAERERTDLNRLERWTGRWATHHVAVSQGVAEFAQQELGFPPSSLTVIPNGIDCARFQNVVPYDWQILGLPSGSQVILGAGRLHRQKGFDLLIRSLAPLLKENPHYQLVICGEGPERSDLERQIRELDLTRQIHLPGRTTVLPAMLRGARLFVLSSRWEGMPNVLLEAIACGTPVLATAAEGVWDIVGSVAPDQVVPLDDVNALRAAAGRLLNGGENRAPELQTHISLHFTTDSTAQSYSRLYEKLLS